MFRTTIYLSFLLALGAAAACSSKSTNGNGNGTGGNGAVIGGGGTSTKDRPACEFSSDCDHGLLCDSNKGVCVTCRNSDDCGSVKLICTDNECVDRATGSGGSGGQVAAGGTTGSSGGGNTSSGGSGNTSSGGSNGLCADTTVTCVDATNAKSCNPATGVVDTFSCIDDSAGIGIISNGCTTDALNGDSCSIDGFSDDACKAGTVAFAYCYNKTDDTSIFNIYVNCFLNNMDGHTVIPCYSKYVTPTMKTAGDCQNAEDICLLGATGEGGAGGAGP